MAIGIVEAGRRRVIAYGKQDSGDAQSIRANTLFAIGSLTKIFTSLPLADMARRKELRFDDPVDLHLPSGFSTPQPNGRAITLADLATHTSGLPLFPPVIGSPIKVLEHFSAADLRAWLGDLALSRDPGYPVGILERRRREPSSPPRCRPGRGRTLFRQILDKSNDGMHPNSRHLIVRNSSSAGARPPQAGRSMCCVSGHCGRHREDRNREHSAAREGLPHPAGLRSRRPRRAERSGFPPHATP